MKLKLALLVGLFAFGYAMSASAGAVLDNDLPSGDLVPDQFDNCRLHQNGPNQGTNQVDSNLDGYGNRCDPDYNNDGLVSAVDFSTFLGSFGGPGTITDHTGDGLTSATDFSIFLQFFGGVPGPSGLACAGTIPCTP